MYLCKCDIPEAKSRIKRRKSFKEIWGVFPRNSGHLKRMAEAQLEDQHLWHVEGLSIHSTRHCIKPRKSQQNSAVKWGFWLLKVARPVAPTPSPTLGSLTCSPVSLPHRQEEDRSCPPATFPQPVKAWEKPLRSQVGVPSPVTQSCIYLKLSGRDYLWFRSPEVPRWSPAINSVDFNLPDLLPWQELTTVTAPLLSCPL